MAAYPETSTVCRKNLNCKIIRFVKTLPHRELGNKYKAEVMRGLWRIDELFALDQEPNSTWRRKKCVEENRGGKRS